MGKVFGILALICGLIGLAGGWFLGFFIPYGAFIIPGLAIVLGIIGIIVDDSKGLGIAGLILGVIGLIVAVVFMFFLGPILAVLLGMAFL